VNLDAFVRARPIDVTAFVGQWPWRLQAAATAADLSAYADRLGVTGLCVSHLASVFGYDTRSGNEALLGISAEDERLWPFAIVNPTEDGWEYELDWAVANGVRGVRIVPGYHGYRLDAPQVGSLLQEVAERGLPLHVCATLEDHRMRHPRYLARQVTIFEIAHLLRRAPRLRLILSGVRAHEWAEIEAQLGPEHPTERVLVDLWFTNGPAGVMAAIGARGQAGRFAYGSCVPVQTPEATAFQLATADISEADRIALCHANAASLLAS